MNKYRIWALNKSSSSIVLEAPDLESAQREAEALILAGEFDRMVEQDAGAICEWEIIDAEELTDKH
jgi:hypothetical protein